MIKSDKGKVEIEGFKTQIIFEVGSIFRALKEQKEYDIMKEILKNLSSEVEKWKKENL